MSSIDRVTCPFEPSHVVEKRRFQAHLIKCKRTLPVNHDFVQCTFYQLHYVKKGKLAEHLSTCEHRLEKEANRVMWEAEASKFAEPNLFFDEAVAQLPISTPNYEDLHENWDTVNWPVFQSERLITDSIHMTVPQGLTKSQRKEFLLRERERLRNIADRQKNYDVQEVKDTRKDNVDTIPRMPEKPVRRPGRIAARFPEQLKPLESERSNDGLSDSTHTRISGGNVYRGAGRGILGWSL